MLDKYVIHILLALVLYIIISTAYHVFLHPLGAYPGPFVAKVSDVYNGFYAYKRRLHLVVYANQTRHGQVIRHGPNKLVFNTTTALKDIYRNDRLTKVKAYEALGPLTVFTATDKQFHSNRRMLIGRVFNDRFMRPFESIIHDQIDLFLNHINLSATTSQSVDITERMKQLTVNVAAQLGFGYDLALQTKDANRFLLLMLESGAAWSQVFLQYPVLGRFQMALIAIPTIRKFHGRYRALLEEMSTARMNLSKDSKHDFYSVLGDDLSKDSSTGARRSDLWAEGKLLFGAAGDTTKTGLSATFFYLSRNRACYQKLADEIRSSFRTMEDINGPALSNCLYLRACVDEALRMSPPVAGTLWRELRSESQDKSFIVDGHIIPRGTAVGVNIYSIHHNKEYFPEPFVYCPERWLDDTIYSGAKKSMRDAFTPFSTGTRGCIGKKLAYLEVGLVLAKTLWCFDFEPASDRLGQVGAGGPALGEGRKRKEEFQLYDTFTAAHKGPHLVFRPRESKLGVHDFSSKLFKI